MLSETAAPQQRVTEDERLRAEEDQAQLRRITLFREERRRRRRSRLVAIATVTAGILLLGASVGWHLRDRGDKATSAAWDSSPAVTQPIASVVPVEKARPVIAAAATPLPAAPSVSQEKKPPAKPSAPARASSKAVKHARAPIPPPKFLDRPRRPSEAPAVRPIAQPAPGTATRH